MGENTVIRYRGTRKIMGVRWRTCTCHPEVRDKELDTLGMCCYDCRVTLTCCLTSLHLAYNVTHRKDPMSCCVSCRG